MPRGRQDASKILTLAGHAESVLREMIFSGELQPGVRIYADETAEKLGMSAIPVREALRTLASRGLVEAIPQRGFRVRPADRDDFAETYDLRLMLDPHAALLAVPLMDEASLAAMDRAFEALADTIRSGDTESYDHDHRAFHFSIYNQCGSRWLLDIQAMLWENSQRYQRLSTGIRGSAEQRIEEHRAIADACRLGDAEAVAALVRRHLEHTREVVYAALSAEGER
ncbi:GntR family transcriptional regulator [Pseudolysinimonas kribbensis]|uniref:GntR family transcriptional regulator n=1 Tax=Pseudolysinimonas kribbensis TaxID=433641 RepID=A0ABQ6K8Y1_9MICO|nr:GntR family transcriptional regulator [Pseudolysinimonas kribbensis]GMA96196.1 GntR family transcriptional regulator [Pseudolysinimonas kribbensis]